MIPLTPGEKANMRGEASANLPDRCLILRWDGPSETADWVADPPAVPCRVASAGLVPSEREVGSRVAMVEQFTVAFEAGTVLAGPDQVDWTNAETGVTRRLQVVGLGGRSVEVGRVVRAVELL